MNKNGVSCQKPKFVLGIPFKLPVKENIEKENITNVAIRRMTGTRCETKERFAWDFTSRSSVTK